MYGGARGIDPDIPGQYLMQALWDVGPSRWVDGTEYAVLWSEIAAYARITHKIVEPWELNAVMSMSKAYVAEKSARDVLRIAPVDRVTHD